MTRSKRKTFISIIAMTMIHAHTFANAPEQQMRFAEIVDEKPVRKITIESMSHGSSINTRKVLSEMQTKANTPFSQTAFDKDLKTLSETYAKVEPEVKVKDGQINIVIKLWQHPMIKAIRWYGNDAYKAKTLNGQLGIAPHSVFKKEEFVKAFNKVKEFYIKKGFFQAELKYRIAHVPNSNDVMIDISVDEGRSAHIENIVFEGFTKEEQSDILDMIHTKKYNFFITWLTGRGIYQQEAIEQDRLTIVNYLHNQGYANAHVQLFVDEPEGSKNIVIRIKAKKGPLFSLGNITYSGHTRLDYDKLQEISQLKDGDTFSPEKIRSAAERIKDHYGNDGYIDTNVQFDLRLHRNKPVYDVHFIINESEQYRIGVIRVFGNVYTSSSVVLAHTSLEPGTLFNADKLKETQAKLMSLGYFKSVNIYPVRNTDDSALGQNYRDINIDIEETSSGSASLFAALGSSDGVTGGLELTENNFNIGGLTRFTRDGISSFRGGGQYFSTKIQLGNKTQSYVLSWLDPYFNGSHWSVGFDTRYAKSTITSKHFKSNTLGFDGYAAYPINRNLTYGFKGGIQNTIIKVDHSLGNEAARQRRNSGIVVGGGTFVKFDSTDNLIRPHRGIRSSLETTFSEVFRHDEFEKEFPFGKILLQNSFYVPVWRRGTLKFKADARALYTLGDGKPELLPANERFYLGGVGSVRGYKTGILGKKYQKIARDGNNNPMKDANGNDILESTDDPIGGATSVLGSVEYMHNIHKQVDIFVFFDAGSISLSEFTLKTFRMSYGAGIMLDIGNRLPVVVGYGIPINPEFKSDRENGPFFSMAGQF